jgi:hypothetical protein
VCVRVCVCRLEANCVVSEMPNGEGCLRALRNIRAGECLSVFPSDDEEEDDDDDEDDEDEDDEDDEDDEEEEEEETIR